MAKCFRKEIENMKTIRVEEEEEQVLRQLLSVLAFLQNGYMANGGVETAPPQITIPLNQLCKRFGIAQISTYASLVLWNYRLIKPERGFCLENLATLYTFTGSNQESWFYLTSVMFEKEGATSLCKGMEALEKAEAGDLEGTVGALQYLAEEIDYLGGVMMRVQAMDPNYFYNQLRPFLAGYNKMAGGSNAQSSLTQFYDIILGVEHKDSYLKEMRNYMPKNHRDFLEALEPYAHTIRNFVRQQNDEQLTLAYDACLAMIKAFRDKHIQIVTRFIVLQKANKVSEKGTGGTSLLPFLKQCRDETGNAAAGSWGKRILTDGMLRLKYTK